MGSPPRDSALAIFTGGSPQEAPSSLSAAGSPPSQVATSTDPPSSPMPVFEDMGQFLKEFATKRGDVPQNNIFDGQTAELEPLPPRLYVDLSPRPLPQPLSLQSTPSQPVLSQLPPQSSAELLTRDFGEDFDTFMEVSSKRGYSGHKAILGARLFTTISTHFRLGRRNRTVLVDGVVLSTQAIADWLDQAQGTIDNWCTLEHRRMRILDRLDTVSATPEHTRWRSWLQSLEAPNCVGSVAAQYQLSGFMASCETELGMR
ncbi:hypothetical protein FRC12_017149 [Ceratobasidium sp. 428]|nr:hypothetical protein FRC12_017149 [Ceratobasidium sp. 428]